MKLRRSATALALCGLLAVSFSAQAQQAGKIFRIGFLDPSSASASRALWNTLQEELSKLGWIEGKNIAFEYRFGENKGPPRVSALAAELVSESFATRRHGDLLVKRNLGNPHSSIGAASPGRKCDARKPFHGITSIRQAVAVSIFAGNAPQGLGCPALREKRHLATHHGRGKTDKKLVPA